MNDTLNTYNLSSVELYLGGLPTNNNLVSGIYPTLTQVNTFNGCIRNVLSNGYYLDMSKALASVNSDYDQCSCISTTPNTTSTTTPYTTTIAGRSSRFVAFLFIWELVAVVFIKRLN